VTRLLIAGGEVLRGAGRAPEPADVLLNGARIERVGTDLPVPEGTERLDATGLIAIPGLINAHTHGHNNLARGLAGRWTLEHLLSFGPAIQANWTAEDHYVSAALGAIEMIKTGATAAYDLYMAIPVADESVLEPVVAAYEDVGLRVVIAPSMADGPFYRIMPGLLEIVPADAARRLERLAALPAERARQVAEAAIKRFDGAACGRVRIAVSPSIPGLCSDELLRGLAALAGEHGVGMHTHVAESRVQIAHAERRWGQPIVSALDGLGALPPGFTAAHGVWLAPVEIRALAKAGATVAHNPASNLRLGSGIAPVRAMLDRELAVGLGTDGSLSSDNQDMFEAMRLAALVSRADPDAAPVAWLDAGEAFACATAGGARAIGRERELGLIEPGRGADLILLCADSMFLKPTHDLVNALVFAETGVSVDTALIDGRVVMRGGRVLGVDERAIRDRARASMERLAHSNRDLFAGAAELAPYITTHCRALVGADPGPAVPA
jgi:5-methylthioadenosine/S-adenosylhomocysteine deaminase